MCSTVKNVNYNEKVQLKNSQVKCNLVHNKAVKVILPGQILTQSSQYPDGSVVAIEPWEQNLNPEWPEPQLCTVSKGKIEIANSTNDPIIIGKDVKIIKIRKTEDFDNSNVPESFYELPKPNVIKPSPSEWILNMKEVKIGKNI